MLKTFSITNFKCFRHFTIADLAPINLITGLNNVGKSALLEALFLHAGRFNPIISLNINASRGLALSNPTPDVMWGWHFLDRNLENTIHLEGTTDDGRQVKLSIASTPVKTPTQAPNAPPSAPRSTAGGSLTAAPLHHELVYTYTSPNGQSQTNGLTFNEQGIPIPKRPPPSLNTAAFLPARSMFHMEDAAILDRLNMEKRLPDILEIVHFFDQRIKGFSLSAQWGPLTIVVDMEGQQYFMPLPFAGEGLARFVCILLHVVQLSPGCLLLIDDIDNGIHYSILRKVWSAIVQMALKSQVQIVATTHNRECVIAAHDACSTLLKYPFRLHRLERLEDNSVKVISYDQEALTSAIAADFEMR